DLPEKNIILSHRLGMKFYTDDTLKTDNFGRCEFAGGALMAQGMYQLVFPDKKFAEFFIDKNQVFSMYTRVMAPSDSLIFTGSPENSRFQEWQRKYTANRNRSGQIQNRLKKGNLTPDSSQLLNKELKQIQSSNNQIWDTAITDLAGTLPGAFIHALRPVRIPESLGKPDVKENQFKQYQYLRTHFFDGLDFADERLLRTPAVETKLDQYFKQIIPQIADTLMVEADQIIERSKRAKNMYQFVVQYLFNLYTDPQTMGTDAVYVHIAEKYYLTGEAPWVDSANLRGITYRVKELSPLLIGKEAPVLEGLLTTDDQPLDIKDIKSEYLILYFWSPDCGFCKEATPKLHAVYQDLKKMGVEIVALDTRLDKVSWLKFIADNQLNWINGHCPGNVRAMIEKYQAFSTPTLYILDSRRRIIAKSISVDQVKPFMTQYASGRK
ncbi:MAG: thioredoxin-like domain-containing protein, partial [Bacteroidales bacterium]